MSNTVHLDKITQLKASIKRNPLMITKRHIQAHSLCPPSNPILNAKYEHNCFAQSEL